MEEEGSGGDWLWKWLVQVGLKREDGIPGGDEEEEVDEKENEEEEEAEMTKAMNKTPLTK